MENEKDLLKQELGNLTEKGDIEKFKEDAELLGHEDIVSLAQEKIDSLDGQISGDSEQRSGETKTVEGLGGNEAEIAARTAEVDQEIEQVQAQAKVEINKVKEFGGGADKEWSEETRKIYKLIGGAGPKQQAAVKFLVDYLKIDRTKTVDVINTLHTKMSFLNEREIQRMYYELENEELL